MTQFFKIFVGLLGAIALFVGTLFVSNPATAKALTPEAAAYEIDRSDSAAQAGQQIKQQAQDYKSELKRDTNYTKEAVKDATAGTQNKLQQAAETVKEKLNLDEPVPQYTKDFLEDVEEKVEETVSPITQQRPGFYKQERHY